MSLSNSTPRLAADRALLVVVDVQERLFPVMQSPETLKARLQCMVRGADLLGVPVLFSEQYTKGLGSTIEGLCDDDRHRRVEKTTFSCFGEPAFVSALHDGERDQIVFCGIEAHICVTQSAVDACRAGFEVFCLEDATSSRLEHTARIGHERMRQAGVVPLTVEGTLLELLDDCARPEFKEVLGLIRECD